MFIFGRFFIAGNPGKIIARGLKNLIAFTYSGVETQPHISSPVQTVH